MALMPTSPATSCARATESGVSEQLLCRGARERGTHLLRVDVALEEADVLKLGLELLKDGADDLAVSETRRKRVSNARSARGSLGGRERDCETYQGPHLRAKQARRGESEGERGNMSARRAGRRRRGEARRRTHHVAQKSMMTSLSVLVAALKASYDSIVATMVVWRVG